MACGVVRRDETALDHQLQHGMIFSLMQQLQASEVIEAAVAGMRRGSQFGLLSPL
jgi:hypothetical protein